MRGARWGRAGGVSNGAVVLAGQAWREAHGCIPRGGEGRRARKRLPPPPLAEQGIFWGAARLPESSNHVHARLRHGPAPLGPGTPGSETRGTPQRGPASRTPGWAPSAPPGCLRAAPLLPAAPGCRHSPGIPGASPQGPAPARGLQGAGGRERGVGRMQWLCALGTLHCMQEILHFWPPASKPSA